MRDIHKEVRYTTVDCRFRVTFPEEWIDDLGWKAGTKLKQTIRGGGIVFERVVNESEADVDGGQ